MSGKKKLFVLWIALIMVTALWGCGSKEESNSKQQTDVQVDEGQNEASEEVAGIEEIEEDIPAEDVTEEFSEGKDAWMANKDSFQGNNDGDPDGSYFEGEEIVSGGSLNKGDEEAETETNETETNETGNRETEPGADVDLKKQETKKLIVIDPGHQAQGNSEQEPIAPGESQTKAKVTSGTCGVASGIPEYQLNLTISKMLKKELKRRGYEIIMTRESHEVDISNSERAMVANGENSLGKKADVFVRIHANGSADSTVSGVLTIEPTKENPYLEADIIEKSRNLSELVYNAMIKTTGANGSGSYVWETDTMSGINWSEVPVTIVELGYMSNPEEDQKMMTEEYQKLLVQGIADGIDDFVKTMP